MRRRTAASRAVLALALVLVVPRAAAAEPALSSTKVRDSIKGAAREAFDRGNQLFQNDDFAGARSEFQRAFELSEDPRVLYNIAVCEKARHRYFRAMDALEKSLRLGGARLSPAYVERAKDTIEALRPFVSELRVDVSEAGAQLIVDGEDVGESPLAGPLHVDVGEHTVVAKKSGFLEVPRQVRVVSGAPAALTLTLEPIQARADVVVVAEGTPRARVLVDGADVGGVPFTGVLDAGRHAISARAPDYVSETRVVDVRAGQPVRLAFRLRREAHEARLRVTTGDDRDVVSLDGRVIGQGGFFGSVGAGEHVLRVARPDARAKTIDLVLRDNETRAIDVSLDAERSGIPTWLWVVGGVVVTSAAATTVFAVATQSPSFQGSGPGTLDPKIVLAGRGAP